MPPLGVFRSPLVRFASITGRDAQGARRVLVWVRRTWRPRSPRPVRQVSVGMVGGSIGVGRPAELRACRACASGKRCRFVTEIVRHGAERGKRCQGERKIKRRLGL